MSIVFTFIYGWLLSLNAIPLSHCLQTDLRYDPLYFFTLIHVQIFSHLNHKSNTIKNCVLVLYVEIISHMIDLSFDEISYHGLFYFSSNYIVTVCNFYYQVRFSGVFRTLSKWNHRNVRFFDDFRGNRS